MTRLDYFLNRRFFVLPLWYDHMCIYLFIRKYALNNIKVMRHCCKNKQFYTSFFSSINSNFLLIYFVAQQNVCFLYSHEKFSLSAKLHASLCIMSCALLENFEIKIISYVIFVAFLFFLSFSLFIFTILCKNDMNYVIYRSNMK